MEKAVPDQSPGSRDSPSTSSTGQQDQEMPEAQNRRSASLSSSRGTKRPPGLSPLRDAPLVQNGQGLPPRPKKLKKEEEELEEEKPDPALMNGDYDDLEDEDCPPPGKVPLVPKRWKSWISFKLEHFTTGVLLRRDSDYTGHCPVPVDCGFRRYFCTEGSVTIRSIRELLEKKFCKERQYVIQFLHPRFQQELDENLTLDILASETEWKRKRPLRILFTLIPPKEPPPNLEKEPMPLLEQPIEVPEMAMEEEEVQIVNQLPLGPHVLLTPVTQVMPSSTPETLQPRQIQSQMTPQFTQMINPLMNRMVPVKRKRQPSETTPPQLQQQHQQPQQIPIQVQQRAGGQMVAVNEFSANQFSPQQLQQLQMLHQRQQSLVMPQEFKQQNIAHMAQSFAGNRSTALYPVQVVPGNQLKTAPVQQQNQGSSHGSSSGQQPNHANAALLHKLLLQQQQQKHLKQKEAQIMVAAVQMQMQRAKHFELQNQAVAAARAMSREPPAKKMTLQKSMETPNRVQNGQAPSSATPQQQTDPKKIVFQVPSPPSPPKPQITTATPSPPAISPLPQKVPKVEGEKLKPYAAQVSVQPITGLHHTPITSKINSPPPSLSPINPKDLDFGSMAKMKNQSLGRTFKETLKTHRAAQPTLVDGIRAQVNTDGKVQLTAPAAMFKNSTIVPML